MNKLISNRFTTSLSPIYLAILCFSAIITSSVTAENVGGSCMFKTPGNPGVLVLPPLQPTPLQ